ncbi:MAG: DUF3380 domain-containing protein [Deltaproteobacteria bacterium]|nr:DUF3380 domain-containing protein [Deltaproteobacteria bacterium]
MRHEDREQRQRNQGSEGRAGPSGKQSAPRGNVAAGHRYATGAAMSRPDGTDGMRATSAGPRSDALGSAAADLHLRHGAALAAAADVAGVGPEALAAVILTEQSGLGEVEPGAMPIRFEPYVFWQRTGHWVVATHRDQAAEASALDAARALDESAALSSLRMGLGQLSGAEAEAAGFADASAMHAEFATDEAAQIAALGTVVAADASLQSAMQSGDWAHVAALRAGPAYHAIGYDEGLAAAASVYSEAYGHGGGDDDADEPKKKRKRRG